MQEYREKHEKLVQYIREKINQMLAVIGTKGIRDEELTDDQIIDLDPIGIISDSFKQILSNLKKTNEDLLITKNEVEAIFNSTGVGLMVIDRDCNIVAANKMHAEMFQVAGMNIIGEKCYRINCDRTTFSDECTAMEIFSREKSVHKTNWERKGKKFELVGSPVKNSNGEIIYAVISYLDVTDKWRMEQELLKNQKLESLSVMAAGIAHDFNNMLTAAFSNLSLMKLNLESRDELIQSIENTEKALGLAKNLVRQVSTFAIGGAPRLSTIKVGETIPAICELTMSGSNCTLTMQFDEDLWPIDADTAQFNQVINNLILNSQQAMPGGGEIRISGRNIRLDADSKIPLPAGDYVALRIRDSGCGILPEHLPNIFDPFYTTKAHGTGIGLATSYSIIKRHHGYISVESEPGSWTEFTLYLPKSKTVRAGGSTAALAGPAAGKKFSGSILIMDDDQMILKATGGLLRASGYDVDTAQDGAEAIEKIVKSLLDKRPYDLVIFDLVIPGGMGGLKAVKKLTEMNTGIRAIVSSGYSNDEVLVNYGAYGFHGIVIKPYNMEELFSEVHRVLMDKKTAPSL